MEVFTMDGTGFLKTVSFGGFDKKDVLAYVDELNTKIYTLEAELEEKKALLENSGSGGDNSGKYEELLAADKQKISELQANNESLRLQVKSIEDELAGKDREINDLKQRNTELEEQLQSAKNKIASGVSDNSAIDLSNVFIEAQKTATSIVAQAKENARKMDEDAKKLANQVVDDANGKASTIVKNADEKANRILADAEDKSSEMRAAAESIKAAVTEEIKDIENNVSKLKNILEAFSNESLSKLDETKRIIFDTQESIRKSSKGSSAASGMPKPAPAPAPAQAPAAAPIHKPVAPVKDEIVNKPAEANPGNKAAPKFSNFGFDLSEIENMAKAIEAEANKEGPSSEENENPNNISLSDIM
jgi:cell division septum initiation protein DivIVA